MKNTIANRILLRFIAFFLQKSIIKVWDSMDGEWIITILNKSDDGTYYAYRYWFNDIGFMIIRPNGGVGSGYMTKWEFVKRRNYLHNYEYHKNKLDV